MLGNSNIRRRSFPLCKKRYILPSVSMMILKLAIWALSSSKNVWKHHGNVIRILELWTNIVESGSKWTLMCLRLQTMWGKPKQLSLCRLELWTKWGGISSKCEEKVSKKMHDVLNCINTLSKCACDHVEKGKSLRTKERKCMNSKILSSFQNTLGNTILNINRLMVRRLIF